MGDIHTRRTCSCHLVCSDEGWATIGLANVEGNIGMEQGQAIQIAREYVLMKKVRVDEANICASRVSAMELAGNIPFQGNIWIVHVPLMEVKSVVDSVEEIVVIVSDSTGEVHAVRGL